MKKITLLFVLTSILLYGCQNSIEQDCTNLQVADNIDYLKIDKVKNIINSMDTLLSRSEGRIIESIETVTSRNFIRNSAVSRTS